MLRHFVDCAVSWAALVVLAIGAFILSGTLSSSTFWLSPLIVAVVFGALVANFFPAKAKILKDNGTLAIATRQILRLGIILYGFKISIAQIAQVGASGVFLAILVVFSTFFISLIVGKFLGLSRERSALIGAGSAVCGAAAVMAASSTIKSREDDVAAALCTVVLFGTIGMFAYPAIFRAEILGFNADMMGIFTGATLHEVAHVVAAGAAMGELASTNAIIVKMLRVILLVPLLVVLSVLFSLPKQGKGTCVFKNFPIFALWFLAAICLNSLISLPSALLVFLDHASTFLLCVAMCALGFTLRRDVLASLGIRPFVLALVLFVWLFVFAFLYINLVKF